MPEESPRSATRLDKIMAEFFPWDPTKYALSIPDMDNQHRVLIQIMNRLASQDSAGAPKADLSRLLAQLVTATVQHFADEELYMASKAYPKLEIHKKIHADLVAQLRGHVDAFNAGSSLRLNRELLDFLKLWLAAHIRGIDMQYAEHVRSAPPGGSARPGGRHAPPTRTPPGA